MCYLFLLGFCEAGKVVVLSSLLPGGFPSLEFTRPQRSGVGADSIMLLPGNGLLLGPGDFLTLNLGASGLSIIGKATGRDGNGK